MIQPLAVLQPLIKSWWLLALCGVLDAIFSVMIFFMQSPDAPLILRTSMHSRSTPSQMAVILLAAGVCTITAGIWSSRTASSWLLVLNGLACSSLGFLISLGARRPVAFRTLALLIVVMAVSIGVYELARARRLQGHGAEHWLLGAAAVISFGFAGVFLAFGLRWINLDPGVSAQSFHWLASYFGFSAICMLGLALRQNGPAGSHSSHVQPDTIHRPSSN